MAVDPRPDFTEAMRQIYVRAKAEVGYNAHDFLLMVNRYGGLETAQRLLTSAINSSGYIELLKLNRPDLTMEALVVQPQWQPLFTRKELEAAVSRLPAKLHPASLAPKDAAPPAVVDLQFVATREEVRRAYDYFQQHARAHVARARNLSKMTQYWLFDPATCGFVPSKFAAYRDMDFDRYERAKDGATTGKHFDGTQARLALETALGHPFMPESGLIEMCRTWGQKLLGADVFDSVDVTKWAFLSIASKTPFVIGDAYTRQDIYRRLQVPQDLQGGDWDTGYHKHQGEWFIFAGVGVGGRTGHNYHNHWVQDDLEWRGKTNSAVHQPAIKSLTAAGAMVHLFTRTQDRDPFVYEGLVQAAEVRDTVPVTVVWQRIGRTLQTLPEEVTPDEIFTEGAAKTIQVNVYERNPAARAKCVAHYGTRCSICGMDFVEVYGPIAAHCIHVHHLKQLADIGQEYEVDPITDLRPVCPNCHAVLHKTKPPMSTEDLRAILAAQRATPSPSGASR